MSWKLRKIILFKFGKELPSNDILKMITNKENHKILDFFIFKNEFIDFIRISNSKLHLNPK